MQRPLMNPSVFDDVAPVPVRPGPSHLRRAMRLLLVCVGLLFRDLLRRRDKLTIEDGPPARRLARAVLYRVVMAAPVGVLFVLALAYSGTRPTPVPEAMVDPMSQGIYFENVDYSSADGTRLQAWLVPAIDARNVVQSGMMALTSPRPAVVLAHGFGATREQMLPLIKPLHDAGIVVMNVALRGSGSPGASAQTFGLNESVDLRASIELLKQKPYVDPSRVALAGVGTGANAVLLAASRDAGLRAIVVDSPVESGDQAVRQWVGPRTPGFSWVDPLCKWTLQMSLGVDVDDLGISQLPELTRRVPTLALSGTSPDATTIPPARVGEIEAFLRSELTPPREAVVRSVSAE